MTNWRACLRFRASSSRVACRQRPAKHLVLVSLIYRGAWIGGAGELRGMFVSRESFELLTSIAFGQRQLGRCAIGDCLGVVLAFCIRRFATGVRPTTEKHYISAMGLPL